MRKENPLLRDLIARTGTSLSTIEFLMRKRSTDGRFVGRVKNKFKLKGEPKFTVNYMAIWKWINEGKIPKTKMTAWAFCQVLADLLDEPVNYRVVFSEKSIVPMFDFTLDLKTPADVFVSQLWAELTFKEKESVWDFRNTKQKGYNEADMNKNLFKVRKLFENLRIRFPWTKVSEMSSFEYGYVKSVETSLVNRARENADLFKKLTPLSNG